MFRKITIEFISALLITLFVYAGLSKLMDHTALVIQLEKSPLLTGFAPFIAVALPLTELAVGILLSAKKTRRTGLYLSLFLLVMFTVYLIAILNFSYYIPCSCGGILQGLSWKAHIIFNTAFILLNLTGIAIETKDKKYPSPNDEFITSDSL